MVVNFFCKVLICCVLCFDFFFKIVKIYCYDCFVKLLLNGKEKIVFNLEK